MCAKPPVSPIQHCKMPWTNGACWERATVLTLDTGGSFCLIFVLLMTPYFRKQCLQQCCLYININMNIYIYIYTHINIHIQYDGLFGGRNWFALTLPAQRGPPSNVALHVFAHMQGLDGWAQRPVISTIRNIADKLFPRHFREPRGSIRQNMFLILSSFIALILLRAGRPVLQIRLEIVSICCRFTP